MKGRGDLITPSVFLLPFLSRLAAAARMNVASDHLLVFAADQSRLLGKRLPRGRLNGKQQQHRREHRRLQGRGGFCLNGMQVKVCPMLARA